MNISQRRFFQIALLLFSFISVGSQSLTSKTNYGFISYENPVSYDSIVSDTSYIANAQKNELFFLLDSIEFIHNSTMLGSFDRPEYRLFTLSLKYYPDYSLRVLYQPTIVRTQVLASNMGYLDSIATYNATSSLLGAPLDLEKASERLFISHPELVKHVWKTIPEPHRLITDRQYLNKRSAEEGIAILLNYDNYETTKKLSKRVKKTGPWVTGGTESLQLSQTHLSNWTKGGESTISLQSDLLLKANYTKKKVEWENFIRQKLGVISTETTPAQINTDQVEIFNKYGIKASERWYYSLVSSFKSQLFTAESSEEGEKAVSALLSPTYMTFALGMDYKPNENFTLVLSPISSKLTWVMDTSKVDQTRYQIAADKKTAFDMGVSVLNTFKWDISTELKLISNLDAFIGYETIKELYQIDWELIFDMRINRYLSTRINTQLRYFTNESNNLQFREYFALSFNYDF